MQNHVRSLERSAPGLREQADFDSKEQLVNSLDNPRPRRWILALLVAGAFSLQGCHTFWHHLRYHHHGHHHAHHGPCR